MTAERKPNRLPSHFTMRRHSMSIVVPSVQGCEELLKAFFVSTSSAT
jgi:hypothetical protein